MDCRYRKRLLPSDAAKQLERAWPELRPSLGSLRDELRKVPYEEFRRRGLTGSQLSFKLDAYYRQRRSFKEKDKRRVEEGTWITRLFRGARKRPSTADEV